MTARTWAALGCPWIPHDLEHQARMHARVKVQQWGGDFETVLRETRESVARGDCWFFHEPQPAPRDGAQLRLFL